MVLAPRRAFLPVMLDVGYSYTRVNSRNYTGAPPGTFGADLNGTAVYNGTYKSHVHALGVGLTKNFWTDAARSLRQRRLALAALVVTGSNTPSANSFLCWGSFIDKAGCTPGLLQPAPQQLVLLGRWPHQHQQHGVAGTRRRLSCENEPPSALGAPADQLKVELRLLSNHSNEV